MLHSILLVIFLLSFPIFILWAEGKSRFVRLISPIIICYVVGITMGNFPGLSLNGEVLETATGISVFLAIPLLLFSANLLILVKQVRPALFSFFLGIVAVIACALLAFWIFRYRVDRADAVAGMMIGVYTGGTQNMSAIGITLNMASEVFVLLNSADIIFSGIYFLFLLTVGKRLLGIILPGYNKLNGADLTDKTKEVTPGRKGKMVHVLAGMGLSALLVSVAIGISFIIKGAIYMPVILLVITTLGIAASFIPKIRELPLSFETANYLILVFALAMGSMSNFAELLEASSMLVWFCGFMVFGSVLLHYILAMLFRVDRDTLIITSTAAIFGPLFIGPVANALGNKEIIPIGIALGLIGYAIGNYLGYGIAIVLN